MVPVRPCRYAVTDGKPSPSKCRARDQADPPRVDDVRISWINRQSVVIIAGTPQVVDFYRSARTNVARLEVVWRRPRGSAVRCPPNLQKAVVLARVSDRGV